MDKDSEAYLDGLVETIGKEPPYETDRRRKATDKARFGKGNLEDLNNIDSLEKEFDLEDLEDIDGLDIDALIDPLDSENNKDVEEFKEIREEVPEKIEEEENEHTEVSIDNTNEDVEEYRNDVEETSEDIEEIKEVEEVKDSELEQSEEPANKQELSELSEKPEKEIEGINELEESSEIESFFQSDELDLSPPEILQESTAIEDVATEIGEEIKIEDEDLGTPEVVTEKKKQRPKRKKDKKFSFSKIFHRLFDNIPLTEEELKAIPTPEEEALLLKQREEEKAKKKEEKKAASEAKKKQAKEDAKKKAADKKAKKAAAELQKKQAKKEAELKRLRAEALEPPEGKINKAGAIIVFLFFIVSTAVIIIGTNIFSYDMSIARATYKFDKQRYTEAYEGIRGLSLREKDLELHDKIYTVMFVNKQLNSYNNFFTLGKYVDALDALIKGLKRYDKYIALASELGIKTDLDYVRKQILTELSKTFGISEREADTLTEISDRQDYSERIYSIISKLGTKELDKMRVRKELVP